VAIVKGEGNLRGEKKGNKDEAISMKELALRINYKKKAPPMVEALRKWILNLYI